METSDGQFAVTMRVMTGATADAVWFEFVTGPGASAMRVEWRRGDKLQIFPAEVARALLRQGYAVRPDAAALEWWDGLRQPEKPKRGRPKAPQDPAEAEAEADPDA